MNRNSWRSKPLVYAVAVSFLLQILAPPTGGAADRPKAINVRFEVVQKKVLISYDLVGKEAEQYRITIFLRKESDLKFAYQPKNITGDIGDGIATGGNRQIVWDLYKEFPKGLEGKDYYFSITVEELSSNFLWWAGAAAVGVGIMGLLIFGSSEPGKPERTTFPMPPGRP